MRKNLAVFGLIIFVTIAFGYFLVSKQNRGRQTYTVNVNGSAKESVIQNESVTKNESSKIEGLNSPFEDVAGNLIVPWEIVFLSENEMLVTERPGKIKKIGGDEFEVIVPKVNPIGEGGLLGMALHPDFQNNHWIYLYYTTKENGSLKNVVVRYALSDKELVDEKVIINNIPAGVNHNGGRLAFGPDGFLYATTGETGNSKLAQDINSLAGKILRVNDEGEIPNDNPFGNAVYSYGHRNPQGLAWDEWGHLWETEHGRSGVLSGYDELNLIEKGKNYGWPIIQGDEARNGLVSPVAHSGPDTTWAPGGMVYVSGSLCFTGLRGSSLYMVKINSQGKVENFESRLVNEFGRLRDVKIGPNGDFYVLTSNRDGRGNVRSGDDKVIRIRALR